MGELDQKNDLSRSEIRRKRRIRNTVISYCVLILGIILILGGAGFGIFELRNYFIDKQTAVQAEEQSEEIPSQQEVITPPDELVSAEEPSEEPTEEVNLLDTRIEQILDTMTIEEKAAALIITTPEELTGVSKVIKAGDGTKTALATYPVGGLVYSRNNIQSDTQFKEMLANTAVLSKSPIFLAVEEIGGEQSVLAGSAIGIEQTMSPSELAASEDGTVTSSEYKKIGTYLSEYGINLNIGPMGGILYNAESPNAEAFFGSDLAVSEKLMKEAVKALNENNVSVCIQGFPGEGEILDTEKICNKTAEELKASDFVIYQAAIENGAQMVQISNESVPAVVGDTTPACLSSSVGVLLRTGLSFDGIIITDALNDEIITSQYSSADAAVLAIVAGADMIYKPEHFKEAYQGILDAVVAGTLKEERIDQSLYRIYRVKYADVPIQ